MVSLSSQPVAGRASIGRIAAGAVLTLTTCSFATAQRLPTEPIVLGRVTLSGDVSVSIAPEDPGYFNYSNYERSTLRLVRLDLSAAMTANEHVSLVGEMRTENLDRPRPYALYVRVRPWTGRAFDVQAGLIPPTFGAFARRPYPADNPLIGYPLAYQYLTSLRADALPASADELLTMRGRGWLSNFTIGNLSRDRGVALVNGFQWDTGVQAHARYRIVDVTASVSTGTPSNPRVGDDNRGRQTAGRVAVRPVIGLLAGASVARGPFVTTDAARSASTTDDPNSLTQTAWGADIEYSRAHYIVRAEAVHSRWWLPVVRTPAIGQPLIARASSIEGRYRLYPGLYAAARWDRLTFSEIVGTTRVDTWDAPVRRLEVGGGYSVVRNVLLKVTYQRNRRTGGRVRALDLGAAQLVYWF